MKQIRRTSRIQLATFFAVTAMSATSCAGAKKPSGAIEIQALRPSFDKCVDGSEGVTLTLNNCIGAEYDFQDRRLNVAYRLLRQKLPASASTTLRDEERAWIASRDKDCEPDPQGGTAAMLDANQCRLNKTVERAVELEKRSAR